MPTLRLAVRFVLLTGVRKGEFVGATWDEIEFDGETWTIPSRRMKGGKPHIVYLGDQALDILTTLRSCFLASRYLHSGRYDITARCRPCRDPLLRLKGRAWRMAGGRPPS